MPYFNAALARETGQRSTGRCDGTQNLPHAGRRV